MPLYAVSIVENKKKMEVPTTEGGALVFLLALNPSLVTYSTMVPSVLARFKSRKVADCMYVFAMNFMH